MAYECEILLDSEWNGSRLTTLRIRYPRIVHSEFMTHRVFSRNASSSRAIPIEKMIKDVMEDPFIPIYWGRNQSGMQARVELNPGRTKRAIRTWLDARYDAVINAERLMRIGAHKQIVNRLLEPWMWITVIVTSTDYDNFLRLRCHKDAQPEIQKIARMMDESLSACIPIHQEWHIPYLTAQDYQTLDHADHLKVSVARCARVSYYPHGKENIDVEADFRLYETLMESEPEHSSPAEHIARGDRGSSRPKGTYNLKGWMNLREMHDREKVWKTVQDIT